MTQRLTVVWIARWALIVVAMGVLGSPGIAGASEADVAAGWVSRIVSLQGEVIVRRHGETSWQPVKLNDAFFAGDQIRVESNSRAGIVLSNDAVMRLDQNTTMIFTEIEQQRTFIFKLLEGAANFFSHRPRSLKILTPFVNGVVEGTEFSVRVDAAQTRIDLFEGRILAENDYGGLELAKGEGAVAPAGGAPQRYILVRPRESVQWAMYYPPVLALGPGVASADISQFLVLVNEGQTAEALARLESIEPESRDATFFICRAALLLQVGRIAQVRSDIQQAITLEPENGDALALKAVIAVVQNRATEAVDTARQAVQRVPQSASANIALTYALQAQFKLSEALEAAQEAVAKAPGSGLAWARLADLQLSVGALDKGIGAAQKAVELAPGTAHAYTVLGFAYLTRIETAKARETFNQAIVLDSAAPLPRLGLGLADIRDGDLAKGRAEIEIAAGLDPGNSLIRSYLGKAYFDEKRGPRDGQQLEIAKALDPNDPTPWFYDAIRKQSLNRPVEALRDLQKSIELNDNRAVYRSRLLLDQDLAARGASLGRIYQDLGFEELSLRQGWRSLNVDHGNYSAHRLLADTYISRPRHEIARVSELLQSQLLQPLILNPVQPQLSEADLPIDEASGPGLASFNEFNPLFVRNRLALQVNGVVGGNDSFGEELALSGLYKTVSFSGGQYHYETDGYRDNNDIDQDIYSIYIQSALSPKFNLQAEYCRRETEQGDLLRNFNLNEFDPSVRKREKADTWRLGINYAFTGRSHVIASYIQQKTDLDSKYSGTDEFNDAFDGFIAEGQHIYATPQFSLISGLGRYDSEYDFENWRAFDTKSDNIYVYSQFCWPLNFNWTIGASYNELDDDGIGDVEEFNPKLGLTWHPFAGTGFRAAYFEVLKRNLIADQTVEPTQVAGFNQFYDDFNGTTAKQWGAAIDQTIANNLYAGAEFYNRQLRVPMVLFLGNVIKEEWEENLLRFYLYYTFLHDFALRLEYTIESFDRDVITPLYSTPTDMDTRTVPISLSYFNPSGFFSRITHTYVDQDITTLSGDTDSDQFGVVDLTVGYRFPERYGVFRVTVLNLFDNGFNYQGIEQIRTSQSRSDAEYYPERCFVAKIQLSF
jgi:tetratricopeptide (TPR) repeat protein